jgi:enoyl-CoA hydratase
VSGEHLLFEVRDGIARLTFNRPEARNALSFAMYDRLAEICDSVSQDASVRVMVLTGSGDKAFAAGTDIAQFRAFTTAQHVVDYEERVERALSALEGCRVPTIAAIFGACTGGGASIAASCDMRIAVRSARFGYPVARTLGNCLAMKSLARVVALIGVAACKELVFTARLVDAAEAKALGFLNEIVDDQPALAARCEALARQIAANAPLTLQATKEALRRLKPAIAEGDGRDLMLMCYLSEDFREGIDAFLNKRPPQWRGK